MSASIGFNIQHHLLIPRSSYIPQVVKRSTEWKPLAKSKVNASLDSRDDATLESETHLQQPTSIFLHSLSFLTHTHTKKLDTFYAHPSLYMHPPVEAAILQSLSESIAIQPIWSSNLSCYSNPLPAYMSSCFFYIN